MSFQNKMGLCTVFCGGRTNKSDAAPSGIATPEKNRKINDGISRLELKVTEIMKAIGLSHGSGVSILIATCE